MVRLLEQKPNFSLFKRLVIIPFSKVYDLIWEHLWASVSAGWCVKSLLNQSKQVEPVLGSRGPKHHSSSLPCLWAPLLWPIVLNQNYHIYQNMWTFSISIFLTKVRENKFSLLLGEISNALLSSCFNSERPDTDPNTLSFLLLPSSRQKSLLNPMGEGTQV